MGRFDNRMPAQPKPGAIHKMVGGVSDLPRRGGPFSAWRAEGRWNARACCDSCGCQSDGRAVNRQRGPLSRGAPGATTVAVDWRLFVLNKFGSSGQGEAKVQYLDGDFRVISPGAYVRCAVTGARIPLEDLKYWSVDRQEAYATPEAVLEQHQPGALRSASQA